MDVVHPITLPARSGPRPRTNYAFPHTQLDQTAPAYLQDEVLHRAGALDGVAFGESFAESSTDAFVLDESAARGPADLAFLQGREFAHLHRPGDGALHMTLPIEIIHEMQRAGWGESHPLAGQQVPDPHPSADGRLLTVPPTAVMVFGPRDIGEVDVVWGLLEISYQYAAGRWDDAAGD